MCSQAASAAGIACLVDEVIQADHALVRRGLHPYFPAQSIRL
jgi:hypothetical protein